MTRRKFVRKLIAAGSAIVVGASWLRRKASPKRFVRAVRAGKYPGELKPLRNISKPGKWSG
ncbi:MAG: hypothetical protein ACYTE3_10455 [Planctomycetota bacterium]|jgi:hypothetical protein